MTFRFLVTGSRKYPYDQAGANITAALYLVQAYCCPKGGEIVQGGMHGVDMYAEEVWVEKGRKFTSKTFRYLSELGRSGGPARNMQMVNYILEQEEPSICLAFPSGASNGTRNCADQAKAAGIPTFILSGRKSFQDLLNYLRETYPDAEGVSVI